MGSFADQMRAFAEKTHVKLETVVKKTAIQLMDGVVLRSPVRSGRFRSNWMVGIGYQVATTVETMDPTGDASRARVGPAMATWKPGVSIFLTSNLPYAKRIEYGWSDQAPGGVVRLTVQDFRDYVRKAIAEAKDGQ